MSKKILHIYKTDGRFEKRLVDPDHMLDEVQRGVGGYAERIKPPPVWYSSVLDCDGKRVFLPQNASYYVNEDGLDLGLETNPFIPFFVGNVCCIPEVSNV
jgi:hypothetical protein